MKTYTDIEYFKPENFRRNQRVMRISGQIRRKLYALIQNRFTSSEIGFLTISNVDLAPDLSNVKIYFTVLDKEPNLVLNALNRNIHFLRSSLYKILRIKRSPTIKFIYDEGINQAARITSLIDGANNLGLYFPQSSEKKD